MFDDDFFFDIDDDDMPEPPDMLDADFEEPVSVKSVEAGGVTVGEEEKAVAEDFTAEPSAKPSVRLSDEPLTSVVSVPSETVSGAVKPILVETEGTDKQEADEQSVGDTLVSYDAVSDDAEGEYVSTVVTATKQSNEVEYPFLLLESDELVQHKLLALKSMLATKTLNPDVATYNVYLKCRDSILKVGVTTSFSLRSIISSDVFKGFSKYVKINPDLKVEGDMMYALCGVSM